MDRDVREAERLWRARPDDEAALESAVHARRRAGVEVPLEMLVRTRRWRAFATFVREWFGRPIESGDGLPFEYVKELESERFGRAYPEALREWWQLVGQREELVEGPFLGNELPGREARDEDFVRICVEVQGVVTFGVAQADLDVDDPPIHARVLDGLEEWRPVHELASEFFLALTMFFRVVGAPDVPHVRAGQCYRGNPQGVIRSIERSYRRLSIASWPYPSEESRFHGDPETLVFVSRDQIDAAARTPQAWERLDALVRESGGVWGPV